MQLDISDLLPSAEGLRDNLWSWAVIGAPGVLLWLFSQAKHWPFGLRVIAFTAAEAVFVFLGVLASERYGAPGSIGAMLLVALPFVPLLRRNDATRIPALLVVPPAAAEKLATPAPSVGPAAAVVAQSLADKGSVERLLEIYPLCLKAVTAVVAELQGVISGFSQSGDGAPWRWMLATLVAESIRDPVSLQIRETQRLMEKKTGLTEHEFDERVSAVSMLMNRHYEEAWCWFARLGMLLWGEKGVRQSAEFHRCYAPHAEMVPELRRVGNRTDLRRIATGLESRSKAIGSPISPAKEGHVLAAELERAVREAAENALYTSDGLDWTPRIYGSGSDPSGGGNRHHRLYEIKPIKPLPQPLYLRVKCSDLVDLVDLRLREDDAGNPTLEGDQPPVVIEQQDGSYLHVTVRYPMVRPPRSMHLTLVREAGDFAVESIEYKADRANAEPT